MQEAIKRLRYVYTSEGADKVASDMQRVNAAHAGIAVQSEKAERATLSLDSKFASLERRYNSTLRAQQDYAKLQQQVNAAVQANPALQERANSVLALAAKHFNTATVANDNFAKSTRQNEQALKNFTYQANDVVTGLLTGQRPFQVLLQQGGQIKQAFGDHSGGATGVMREFGQSITAFFTPARLAATGIVALGAAALAATVSWKNFALALDDTARQAGITSSEMAKLQAAASFKGIGNDDFAKAMGAFSQNVYEAKNNMGGLAEVFRANGGVVPKDFESSLLRVADLVKNASSDIQKQAILRQAGLPSDMAWVRLMSQGAEGIKKAKEEAVAFGGAANDNLVAKAREFDDAWNRITTNFGLRWRSALLDVVNFFENFSDRATAAIMRIPGIGKSVPTNLLKDALAGSGRGSQLTQSQADEFYSATGAGGGTRLTVNGRTTVDPNAVKQLLSLEQQRIGILGQLATVQDQVRSKEIEITLARLNGVKVSKEQEQAILALARANADGTLAIRAMADGFRIEAETVNMSVGAATAYRIEQEKVLEAKRLGISVSAQTAEAWRREAQAAGEAAQALEKARINSQIKFDRQTAFLSPDDVRIAQQLRGLYGDDVPKALASSEAAAMRFNNALSDIGKAADHAFSGMISDVLSGVDAMDSLIKQTAQLGKSLSEIGTKSLMGSLKSGLSGNGFNFDPLSLGAGVLGIGISMISNLFKGNKEAEEAKRKAEEELRKAQEHWASIADQVRNFNTAASGFDLNPAVQAMQSLVKTATGLIDAARAAKAPTQPIFDAYSRQINNTVLEFAYGPLSQMSDLGEKFKNVAAGAQQLRDELTAMGLPLEKVPHLFAAIADGVSKQIEKLRGDYNASIEARLNAAQGKDYLNEFAATVKSLNADLETASALGIDGGRTGVAYQYALQKIIDENKLVGASFEELLTLFPAFRGQLHAFTGEVEDAAAALAAAADRARTLNDRLFAAGNDTSTLAGALAAFDRKAQQEREAEIAAGGQNIALLEQVLAAERFNVVKSFADQAIEAEKRLGEARLREYQTFQKYLDNLRGGSLSTMAPGDRLAAAQGIYQRSIADYRAGTVDASAVTSAAEDYRSAGRSFYGSTGGYQDIYSRIQQDIATLMMSTAASSSLGGSSITPLSSGVTSVPVSAVASNSNSPVVAAIASLQARLDAQTEEIKNLKAALIAVHAEEGPNIKRGADATVELKNAVATASALGPARAA